MPNIILISSVGIRDTGHVGRLPFVIPNDGRRGKDVT